MLASLALLAVLRQEPTLDSKPSVGTAGRLIFGKPGVWTGEGCPPLRVESTPRKVGRNWAFDVETRTSNAYVWKGVEVAAGDEAALHTGTVTPNPDGRGAVALVARPRSGSLAELSLYFPKEKVWFRFEWKGRVPQIPTSP